MLYKETVSKEMWELLQRLMKDEKLKDFILVGGTALSLQIGHRLSIDIDLFTTQDFDADFLHRYLQKEYKAKDSIVFENTVMTYVENIKVDLISHKYPIIEPKQELENIRMISIYDIGAMKLHAIFQSGERLKDFVDMYFLLEKNSLSTYLKSYEEKYNGNSMLVLHSLTYYNGIREQYYISIVKGKENDWRKMQMRLQKATNNLHLKFGTAKEEKRDLINKGRGFKR